ncbi:MAG TPA: ribosome-associated translation inhibitor RaiA [Candidatus Paceibacterota bacterium]|nr:ribosome-associated translation inhibitor RaiA [Candidatus Paceibacterota bacterium]
MSNFNLNIKSSNIDLTPELKNHISSKILHIEKFFNLNPDEQIIVEVEVEKITGEHHKQGQIFRAEINLTHKGDLLRTESTQQDIINALDVATSEIVIQVKKYKGRQRNLLRKGGNMIKKLLKFGRD